MLVKYSEGTWKSGGKAHSVSLALRLASLAAGGGGLTDVLRPTRRRGPRGRELGIQVPEEARDKQVSVVP